MCLFFYGIRNLIKIIELDSPDDDGGSPINLYEVVNLGCDCTSDSSLDDFCYRGIEPNCVVGNLLPGRSYSIKLRALNEVGKGEWSDLTVLSTASGSPDSPAAPQVSIKSPTVLLIQWCEPAGNGSPITEYRLEFSTKRNEAFKQV